MSATMVKPLWGSDRNDYDGLGLRALADPHAAITREQYDRTRSSDRELVAMIIERLGPEDSQRIYRMSTVELAILAHLERTST